MKKQVETGLANDQKRADDESTQLGLGWRVRLDRRPGSAVVRVHRDGETAIELEVRLTAEGPVLRARGRTLELEATHDISVRCERFSVEASKDIELRARGEATLSASTVEVEATSGDVHLAASDDVQLEGEMVLLNCDRPEPLPQWTGGRNPDDHAPTLPTTATSGDDVLIQRVLR